MLTPFFLKNSTVADKRVLPLFATRLNFYGTGTGSYLS